MSIYLFVNPFQWPYRSYDIRRELVDKPFMIYYFPSNFYPTLGHHQVGINYKSDVTFYVYYCFPAEYHKIDTATRKDAIEKYVDKNAYNIPSNMYQ